MDARGEGGGQGGRRRVRHGEVLAREVEGGDGAGEGEEGFDVQKEEAVGEGGGGGCHWFLGR